MTDKPTDQRWAYALGRGKVGQEHADRLTEELNAAVAADFLKWQEKEERLARLHPQVVDGVTILNDVTSFIFDHLLPQLLDRPRSKGSVKKKHRILDLVDELEPDQFVGLVLVYAHRIGDRDGVSRAFDILMAPSSFYRQHLRAYRNSRAGGRIKARLEKGKLAGRNEQILKRASELLTTGKPKRNIAGILGKKFSLTSTAIRLILRNSKMW